LVLVRAANKPSSRSKTYGLRRESIIDVAASMFAERGYAATGVADLGAEVGLERGALYYYIGSKEQVLAEIHDRVMTPLLRESEEICQLPGSALARLRLVSESLLRQIIQRREHVWVFLHEYRALTGERRTHFKEQRDRFENQIDSLIMEAVKEGTLRVENHRVALLFFLGAHNYTYQWIRSEGEFVSAATLSRQYCAIFFRGLAVQPLDLAKIEVEAKQLRLLLAPTADDPLTAVGDTSI
jgi:TetR/AcrR family transcriptional regulator, cholesterol catabolism regulator